MSTTQPTTPETVIVTVDPDEFVAMLSALGQEQTDTEPKGPGIFRRAGSKVTHASLSSVFDAGKDAVGSAVGTVTLKTLTAKERRAIRKEAEAQAKAAEKQRKEDIALALSLRESLSDEQLAAEGAYVRSLAEQLPPPVEG